MNNIKNVSMDEPYAGICGITKEEMLTQMSDDIDALAEHKRKDDNKSEDGNHTGNRSRTISFRNN